MTRSNRGRARVLAGVLAATLMVGACSNSDDDAAGEETSAPASEAVAETTAAAPETTAAAADTTAAAEEPATDTEAAPDTTVAASERDTFVAIEGVPGVSDTEIKFAAFGTDSNNPLGTCVLTCYSEGIEAYFAYRNAEGGIYGRQLVLAESLDDELGKNLERAQDVAAGDFFGAFSATQIASGWATLSDAGMPLWTWSIHKEGFGSDSIWGYTGAICFDCAKRTVPYLTEKVGGSVIASLGYGVSENSKLCSQQNAYSIEQYGEQIGGATVGYLNDDLPFGLPNGVGPEVTAMKEAGVDVIFTCLDLNAMKTIGEELARQGMDDVVMVHPNTYNQGFVEANADIFEGDYVTTAFPAFEYDTKIESQEKFREFMQAQGSELSELAMFGWINAAQAFNGLLAAGPDFDRESLIAAINAMTADSAEGLIPAIDWTRQHVQPTEADRSSDFAQECFSIVQIQGGKFVPVAEDQTKPFICWSNSTTDYSEPEFTTFV